MTVQAGQTYRDLDPRMAGRTLKVVSVPTGESAAVLEVLTNASDVQALLDDKTPGTRNYQPKDRRGTTTRIAISRLGRDSKTGFALVEEPPVISGPAG